jgi:hypothetical protein
VELLPLREVVLRLLVLRPLDARPPRRAAAVRPADPELERADARPPRVPAARTLIRLPLFVPLLLLREAVLRPRVPVVLRLRVPVVLRLRVPVERPVVLRPRVPVVLRLRVPVLRVPVLRVPVLRLRVPPVLRELLPDDDLADAARERDVVEPVERLVVPVRLRVPPDRAARTFSTPSSLCCIPSDWPTSLLCCSVVESSVVVLNG